jgi:hypothetical protein
MKIEEKVEKLYEIVVQLQEAIQLLFQMVKGNEDD